MLATVVWLIAIGGFGIYVSKFGSYDKTYGTLGGMIVLLLVFYISSMVIMFGAATEQRTGQAVRPGNDRGHRRSSRKGQGRDDLRRQSAEEVAAGA